jgi:hypothetical protein
MTKLYFLLYYNEEQDSLVEVIKADNKLFIRGTEEVTPYSKAELKAYTKIGEIYSNKTVELKGRCSLRKINSDGSTTYIERGYFQTALQEGVACKISNINSWYRTNIVTGITKNNDTLTEFYTLSGSHYRIIKND